MPGAILTPPSTFPKNINYYSCSLRAKVGFIFGTGKERERERRRRSRYTLSRGEGGGNPQGRCERSDVLVQKQNWLTARSVGSAREKAAVTRPEMKYCLFLLECKSWILWKGYLLSSSRSARNSFLDLVPVYFPRTDPELGWHQLSLSVCLSLFVCLFPFDVNVKIICLVLLPDSVANSSRAQRYGHVVVQIRLRHVAVL